jgi:sulfatase maturation enzyme AslB (radical SAM superfamily)
MTHFPINEYVLKIVSPCNLNCSYCYEYNLGDESWKQSSKLMSIDTAKIFFEKAISHCIEYNLEDINIGLHGGEPLLYPVEGLRRILSHFQKHADKNGIEINFNVQTNGTLLDKKFIDLFKEFGVSVSVSIDGNKEANDRFRLYHNNKSSFDDLIRGVNLIQSKAPDLLVGILSVIDIRNDPLETFDFLADFNVSKVDFMLPLNNWENPPLRLDKNGFDYGEWYWKIYKEWVNGRHSSVEIRFLTNIISKLLGGYAIYEVMTLDPVCLLTINSDGLIEGVDTMKSSASGLQKSGLNVFTNDISDVFSHDIIIQRQIGSKALSKKCNECSELEICSGGYYPHRFSKINKFKNESIFCDDLFWLISKIREDLLEYGKN